MLFNSFSFIVFLPLVFALYWFVFKKHLKAQNILLLVASYVFYGWWDYRFLALILFSTLVDYFVGIALEETSEKSKRKALLWVSILINLGLLGFFKYYNFFINSWVDAWAGVGVPMHKATLQIILPVGISFYTFQTLSYTIDIYREKLKPATNFVVFAAYVSFFPQLVAGPIERATNLLPQFYKKRVFKNDEAVIGLRLMLYGLFKKIVIADQVAPIVNEIFDNYGTYSSPILVLGTVLFALQIYCDFSGYSDIAIGVARLFGFKLMINFRYPYFSRNIGEFWRRWHISLSTWFRDYLYIPLGGSRGNRMQQLRNIIIIFLVSGFWHGANWTFLAWGGIHALLFIPLIFFKSNRKHLDGIALNSWLPSPREAFGMLFTFTMVCVAWVFFRAPSITESMGYIWRMVSFIDVGQFSINNMNRIYLKSIAVFCIVFVCIEWYSRNRLTVIGSFFEKRMLLRYGFYFFLILSIILNIKNEATDFIYFQF